MPMTVASGRMTALMGWAALFEAIEPDIVVAERLHGRALHTLVTAAGEPGLLSSRGLTLSERDAASHRANWRTLAEVPAPLLQRLLSAPSAILDGQFAELVGPGLAVDVWQNAVRAGIVQVVRLPSQALVAAIRGKLMRYSAQDGWTEALVLGGQGKPARGGMLADTQGRVWMAEYALNHNRKLPVQLWCSRDDGRSFQVAHTFAAGTVRHVHFVQQDPTDGSLWMGTGDTDAESGLWRSTDGDTWQRVGGSSQLWRAIGLAFLPDCIVWGTDAGSDAPEFTNVAVRLDRATGELTTETALQGPVHGVTALPGGRAALATGCEGGRNEKDSKVHLWLRAATGGWREIAQWHGGPQPPAMQYAIAHFVHGQATTTDLWVQLRGTTAMPLGAVRLLVPA